METLKDAVWLCEPKQASKLHMWSFVLSAMHKL